MRLAVLSDVHGIMATLDAVLEEISKEGVDGIIVAGDIVAGPNPVEVVARLRELGCWMIRGNNEDYVLEFASGTAPDWWYTCRQFGFIRWNYEQIDPVTMDFLRTLPDQVTVQVDGTDPIRVVHGSPRSASELIYPDQDISKLDSALEVVAEPVVIFGHSHETWLMRRNGKLALNPGSVSMSFEGAQCGNYALLTWEGGHWTGELRKVYFDLEPIRRAYVETGLLEKGNSFARCGLASIKAGVNYLPPMLQHAYRKAAEAGYGESPFVPDELWEAATREFEELHYKDLL